MVIKTKEFTFSKPTYWRILFLDTIRRSLWAALFLVGIAVFQSTRPNSLGYFWLAFPACYFLYVMIRCYIHTSAKKNTLFFAERHFEIDDQVIHCIFNQGTVNKIEINSIARVVKNKQFYRLFLNKKQFIYLPTNAFRTPGDIKRFDEILKARKPKNPQAQKKK